MTLIIDTQIWIWLMSDPHRISGSTLARLARRDEVLLLSVASCWEASIKYGLGKLQLAEAPAIYVPAQIDRLGLTLLPIELPHVLNVASLPHRSGHGDPFDRLIISQALMLGLPVLTSDRRFVEYGVEVLAP